MFLTFTFVNLKKKQLEKILGLKSLQYFITNRKKTPKELVKNFLERKDFQRAVDAFKLYLDESKENLLKFFPELEIEGIKVRFDLHDVEEFKELVDLLEELDEAGVIYRIVGD